MSNTQVLEYRTRDKSNWGEGEWQDEPDKAQWVDEATGLDCLLVRGPSGALCGYVGVPESHPWFGKGYGECTQSPPCEASYCEHSPEGGLRVHGGITFADRCADASRANWQRWCDSVRARADEAVRYPNGDMGRLLRERGNQLEDFDAWAQYMEAASICHRPLDGRPDHVWWFGFDCAHYGDFSPAFDRDSEWRSDSTYKARAYVEREIAYLARQLADITRPPANA